MGLEEKRLLKQVQEQEIPQAKAQIKTICGADIAIELDQNSFLNDPYGAAALGALKRSGLDVVIEALQSIGKDDMGKEALRESFKKIVFKQLPNEKQNDFSTSMAGGVLTLQNHWGGAGYTTSRDIESVIQKQL